MLAEETYRGGSQRRHTKRTVHRGGSQKMLTEDGGGPNSTQVAPESTEDKVSVNVTLKLLNDLIRKQGETMNDLIRKQGETMNDLIRKQGETQSEILKLVSKLHEA